MKYRWSKDPIVPGLIFFLAKLLQIHAFEPDLPISSRIEKRSTLTYPPNGVFQVTLGISVEGNFERNVAGVGLAFQHNANLPNDTRTFFLPQISPARMLSIYDHLRKTVDRYGFDGLECLKKMVCQIGETPLHGGLLEEIVTLVLTPSQHRTIKNGTTRASTTSDELNQHEMLLESEILGKQGGNCTSSYPNCAKTPLDMISYLEYV